MSNFLTATALLVACLSPLAAMAGDLHEDAAVLAVEQQWIAANKTHDTGALERILADDFLDTSNTGTLRTKADLLKSPAAPPPANEQFSNWSVRVFGDTAIVTGLNTVSGTTPQGQSYTARVRFTDVFQKQQGTWRAIGAQEAVVRPPGS
ncbi:MAG: nuclear transport factor 2 family protein [Vulcanimicrobiaceae bacterium]